MNYVFHKRQSQHNLETFRGQLKSTKFKRVVAIKCNIVSVGCSESTLYDVCSPDDMITIGLFVLSHVCCCFNFHRSYSYEFLDELIIFQYLITVILILQNIYWYLTSFLSILTTYFQTKYMLK